MYYKMLYITGASVSILLIRNKSYLHRNIQESYFIPDDAKI